MFYLILAPYTITYIIGTILDNFKNITFGRKKLKKKPAQSYSEIP
jgi:hypothetical protein